MKTNVSLLTIRENECLFSVYSNRLFRAYLTTQTTHAPTFPLRMADMSSTITIVCIWGSLILTGICCATNCLGLFPDPRDPDDTQLVLWYWLRRLQRARVSNNQVHVTVNIQSQPTRARLVRPPQQSVFLPPSEPRTRLLEKLNSVLFRETHTHTTPPASTTESRASTTESPASTADFVYSIEIRPLPPAVLSDSPGAVTETEIQLPPEPPNEPRPCAICLTEEPTVGCYPCGHLCMCAACAALMLSSRATCPMCRQAVTEVLKFSSRAPVGVELEARVMLVRAGGLAGHDGRTRQDGRSGIPVDT